MTFAASKLKEILHSPKEVWSSRRATVGFVLSSLLVLTAIYRWRWHPFYWNNTEVREMQLTEKTRIAYNLLVLSAMYR